MVGCVRAWLELDQYARGSHHHLFCLVDALSSREVGAHALGFDSIAALLGRLFLRPVSSIASIVLIEPPPQKQQLSDRWVAELRYSYLG